MVGFIASLLGIWEFVRRAFLKKAKSPRGGLLVIKKHEYSPRRDEKSPRGLDRSPLVGASFVQDTPSYRPGQPIAIRKGPFAGLKGTFEKEMASGRVATLIEICGRQARLLLSSDMVSAL